MKKRSKLQKIGDRTENVKVLLKHNLSKQGFQSDATDSPNHLQELLKIHVKVNFNSLKL